MADDGHTINVGPVTIGEPLPKAVADPIDTDAVRRIVASGPRPSYADTIDQLCGEVDRLRAELAEQRTLMSEIAVEREQALAEAHRLRGEWEDAIANNEGVWEEGFHKGREYQREAERRG